MKDHAFQGFLCLEEYSPAKPRQFITLPFLLVWLLLVAALPAWAQAPALTWSNNIGARAFALDALNNVYASAGNQIIVLDSTGAPQSTNVICPLPGIVKRDAAGNFYYGGNFDGTQNFGGITLIGGCTNCAGGHYSPGWPSCYLAKYSGNGTLQWAIAFGINADYNRVSDLALNPDGTITVGYDTSGIANVGLFSPTGSNIWTSQPTWSIIGDSAALKVGGFIGTNGTFLEYRFFGGIVAGFYDANGGLTSAIEFPQLRWKDPTSLNGTIAATSSDEAGVCALSAAPEFQPVLLKNKRGGTNLWTQTIGSDEQYLLGADSSGGLYLACTNGAFSSYDGSGNYLWSTNYGTVIVSMLLDNSGNGVLSFANGSIARFGTAAGSRPQLLLSRSSSTSGFHFTIVSAPQAAFQILESTDLVSWSSLGTVTNSSGHLDFTDTNSTAQVKRFYKAVQIQ